MSQTVAVTFEEGGNWIPLSEVNLVCPPDHAGWRVHAVKFDDGRVWDAYNGWRPGLAWEPSYSHWGIFE